MSAAFPVIIRQETLNICEGDPCAAALLDLFQRWSKGKAQKKVSPWIYDKSQDDLRGDLLGVFSRNEVVNALKKLRAWGYVMTRRNPFSKFDRRLQYQVNGAAVNAALGVPETAASSVPDVGQDSPVQDNRQSQAGQSSLYTKNQQTLIHSESTTPARARDAVAVFQQPSNNGELVEKNPERPEVPEQRADIDPPTSEETPDGASAEPPPVSAPPSPAAEHADIYRRFKRHLAAIPARLIRDSGSACVRAWLKYADAQPGVNNPPGLVNSILSATPGQWPPGVEPERETVDYIQPYCINHPDYVPFDETEEATAEAVA